MQIIDKIIVTYTDHPRHGDFAVTVPPGDYSRDELLHIYMTAFMAAEAAAPAERREMPVSIEIGTADLEAMQVDGIITITR